MLLGVCRKHRDGDCRSIVAHELHLQGVLRGDATLRERECYICCALVAECHLCGARCIVVVATCSDRELICLHGDSHPLGLGCCGEHLALYGVLDGVAEALCLATVIEG